MKTITVTEALRELSLYDEKIDKALQNVEFVALQKKGSTLKHEDIAEATKRIKANYCSVRDLIENRNKIKAAVVRSNAVTIVTVGTKNMTVAEAIERKHSIEYEKKLLSKLVYQLTSAEMQVKRQNEEVQRVIDKLLSDIAGSDSADIAAKQKVIETTYRETNEWELLDPINIKAEADTLDDEISDFLANVDTALSICNAVTTISIDM